MKINTDGVLLAAMVQAVNPARILDIGTGTGVIALMLAQRYEHAQIEAIEIEELASIRASENFKQSTFSNRLKAFHSAVEDWTSKKKYDLIVSNPPFFVNDLKNTEQKKGIARHTYDGFFKDLIIKAKAILSDQGEFWLILPVKQAHDVLNIASQHQLYPVYQTAIHSDANKAAFRMVIALSKQQKSFNRTAFYIYEEEKVHTQAYKDLLKDFFLAF